ncbi:MAG TPA: hypothetical protein VMT85_18040 [Thermoanaerobaculia bacterium]|nr:hypothetical protein [Thermoanaerobaculia bacterium]
MRLPDPSRGWPSSKATAAAVVALLGLVGVRPIPAQQASEPSEAGESGVERSTPAIHLERGSRSSRQIVAIGRDLVIDGEALRNAVVLDGEARIGGSVAGDVIVLGGDAIVSATGHVAGDVYALGGEVHNEGGRVDGRAVAYPAAPAGWLLLIEGPSVGLDPFSPLVLGAKLALLAAWLAVSLLLVVTFPRPLADTAREVSVEPFRCFFTGVVGVATAALGVVLTSGFASAIVGVPLILVVVLAALALKLWGSVAVFLALGAWVLSRLGRRRAELLEAIMVGLVLLGLTKLLPYAGVVVWTTLTLIGIGAALRTKFGSREPWLAPSPAGVLTGIR